METAEPFTTISALDAGIPAFENTVAFTQPASVSIVIMAELFNALLLTDTKSGWSMMLEPSVIA
jgi:hypothetical protein